MEIGIIFNDNSGPSPGSVSSPSHPSLWYMINLGSAMNSGLWHIKPGRVKVIALSLYRRHIVVKPLLCGQFIAVGASAYRHRTVELSPSDRRLIASSPSS